MASQDVIELGSSDEESQPAPKKPKPMPNAMVCIPSNIKGITVKPTKTNVSLVPSGLGKGITMTKVPNMIANPYAIVNKVKSSKPPQKGIVRHHLINPVVAQQNANSLHNKGNTSIMKVSRQTINKPVKVFNNPIRIQSSSTFNLPPSITIKRTVPPNKSLGPVNLPKVKKKPILPPTNKVGEVLTVELDDDEESPSTSSPLWYIKPDEGTTAKAEEENNKEPEPTKLIEITIEDSPVKPLPTKRTFEVGSELAITIDDSPVKPAAEKHIPSSGSDQECGENNKEHHSKKKLIYPKEAEEREVIEIEVEPVDNYTTILNSKDDGKNIEESGIQNVQTSTSNKNNLLQSKQIDAEIVKEGEFHPVYQRFINLCFQLEDSEDMKKIVEKKIKAYYKQVPKEYTESEEFVDMVSGKILAMQASPEKMYLYIKDIVDELNLQRKMSKVQHKSKDVESKVEDSKKTTLGNTVPIKHKIKESEQLVYVEENDIDSKRQRQIRKLEKTIKKLHRAIQKLEEQEVDFDDEDDSVYLLTERYKERMVRVYAKFCQLTNTKLPSEPRIHIDARPGQPTGPAKLLEKWINKKVPIGTPLPFPDFHDVLRCVREANDADKLGWNEADIMEEARDLFTRCGKKLQRRRQENEWRSAASRLALDVDPAEKSNELKKKLEDNKELATKKETDIFNKYADRQNQLKLEAEEIGDKEAEESPIESEDEEPNEESVSLENTEKRKERLKRLLQEKSKKEKSEGKQNQSNNEFKNSEISGKTSKIMETVEEVEKVENVEEVEIERNENKEVEKKENFSETSGKPEIDIEKSLMQTQDAQSISDDSDKVESDIDELHLLQKLHSGNDAQASTNESSNSDSPIAISDTLESSDENKEKPACDVISIENSSYSEGEIDKEEPDNKDVDNFINSNAEVEFSSADTEKVCIKTNNDEYSESVEDILLASSEDEAEIDKQNSGSVNLSDGLISIDETVLNNNCEGGNLENKSPVITESNQENVINDSTENNTNNHTEKDNNIIDFSFVENNSNDNDKHIEKHSVVDSDITGYKESKPDEVTVMKVNIESTDSSQESQVVPKEDILQAAVNIISDNIKLNDKAVSMEVAEVDNEKSDIIGTASTEADTPTAMAVMN